MPRMTRRQFFVAGTGFGMGLITVMLSVPALGFLLSPLWTSKQKARVRVGSIDSVPVGKPTPMTAQVPVGEGFPVPPQSRVVYVVKYDNGDVRAFSNICTHMQCDVHWDPDLSQFLCPCHGGLYDIHGKNIGGPPPQPLPQWKHEIVEENGSQVLYIQNELDESI